MNIIDKKGLKDAARIIATNILKGDTSGSIYNDCGLDIRKLSADESKELKYLIQSAYYMLFWGNKLVQLEKVGASENDTAIARENYAKYTKDFEAFGIHKDTDENTQSVKKVSSKELGPDYNEKSLANIARDKRLNRQEPNPLWMKFHGGRQMGESVEPSENEIQEAIKNLC